MQQILTEMILLTVAKASPLGTLLHLILQSIVIDRIAIPIRKIKKLRSSRSRDLF